MQQEQPHKINTECIFHERNRATWSKTSTLIGPQGTKQSRIANYKSYAQTDILKMSEENGTDDPIDECQKKNLDICLSSLFLIFIAVLKAQLASCSWVWRTLVCQGKTTA